MRDPTVTMGVTCHASGHADVWHTDGRTYERTLRVLGYESEMTPWGVAR